MRETDRQRQTERDRDRERGGGGGGEVGKEGEQMGIRKLENLIVSPSEK